MAKDELSAEESARIKGLAAEIAALTDSQLSFFIEQMGPILKAAEGRLPAAVPLGEAGELRR